MDISSQLTLIGLHVPPKPNQYEYKSRHQETEEPKDRQIPSQIMLGRADQTYSSLPASTMLPLLQTWEERQETGIRSLREIPTSQCQPFSVRIRPEHIEAMDHFLAKSHSFPETEEEEESQLAYEGWDEEFWRKRQEDQYIST